MLYNRASADPNGHPWSDRKKYVWWDAQLKEWTGYDAPDFELKKDPQYEPPRDARAEDAIGGAEPFIMQADGVGWIWAPGGLRDGPLPAHYEPEESPVKNLLYAQNCNPVRQKFERPENPYNVPDTSNEFPYVFTTYRLTEHHTAGGMTRTLPHLSELQPEFFCEVSPELAAECGLENGGWATLVTSRAAIEARVLVTKRMKPLRIGERIVHQIGVPYHWGYKGISVGDSGNDLLPVALDPNVHIQEAKAATCDIRPGRKRNA